MVNYEKPNLVEYLKRKGKYTEEDDEYIIKTAKNPDWHSISLSANDKNDIEHLKDIKQGIDSSIKFDLSAFPDDEIKIFKRNKII